MNFRCVLAIVELGGDPAAVTTTIRRVAPAAERLVVVAHLPEHKFAWLPAAAPPDQEQAAERALEALRAAVTGMAGRVEVQLAPDLDAESLVLFADECRADLIATGAETPLPVVSALRTRAGLPLLRVGLTIPDRPIRHLFCVAIGSRARRAVAAFLRDRANAGLRATVLTAGSQKPDSLTAVDVGGFDATVDFISSMPEDDSDFDLLVLARFPGALMKLRDWPYPLLILRPVPLEGAWPRRAIDVADPVDDGGALRVRIDYTSIGRHEPIPDQEVAFVARGRIVASVTTRNGEAEIPATIGSDAFGVFRVTDEAEADPLLLIEQQLTVIRPSSRPMILFDPALSDDALARLATLNDIDLLAVRMRPMRSCGSIRARLRKAGLPTLVADASTILDEGAALDVPEQVDAVRLARVAARMLGTSGFPIVAIVHQSEHRPETIRFDALRPEDLDPAQRWPQPLAPQAPTLARRLDHTTGSSPIDGNRIEVEMDNTLARNWLLEAIDSARETIHFQVYMALDDDVGRLVEAALADAGARGVRVLVVVDSLHALDGSLGQTNPLLSRLGARPGVEVREVRPVTGVPTLEDLKQRDHRKVCIVDGRVALVGGRNLSHEYYTGFAETNLTRESHWREVPWLDAGARVEGPAVAALENSFLDSWTAAGGTPFDIDVPPPAGASRARVVVHHGLRDARTLEAYLALIDAAQSHVYAVNGFPLILEIQHAMLRAIARGVRVRTLFGNLTPTHAERPFKGRWSTARMIATDFVHSRMDAIVAAGGEGYEFVVAQQPEWEPGLGPIHPHVHAKLLSVDGQVCSVGSANLDITAGYWESELILIVEDPVVTRKVEAHIEQLIAGSQAVDRSDAGWQQTARRRHWMRHWPGVLSV